MPLLYKLWPTPTTRVAERPMAELRMMEDLMELDVVQLQNLCMRRNLDSSGNKAALLDRLLHRLNQYK